MEKRKPGVDVILDVLKAAHALAPASPFIASLYQQYQERGFLTRKQLEGLHSKASKLQEIPVGKLATLEAIILKMPQRFKSETPVGASPIYSKSIPVHSLITSILEKYPLHKQVLHLKNKFDSNTPISPAEMAELARFYKVLIKDKET
jgi:hypothetical protein